MARAPRRAAASFGPRWLERRLAQLLPQFPDLALCVAFSGGADSTALLAALAALALIALVVLLPSGAGHSLPPAPRHLQGTPEEAMTAPAGALESAALGAADPAYRVSAGAGTLSARSRAQDITSHFSGTGVTVSSGALSLGLQLRALGFGSALAPVAAGGAVTNARL